MANTEDQVCRICKSSNISRFHHLNFNYARCRRCGCYTKILNQADYDALDRTYDPGALLHETDAAALRRMLQVDDAKSLLGPVLARCRGAGTPRLLDIGCGQGANLLAARELGCDVVGVEPSLDHSKVARDLFGLPVHDGYFSADRFADERFDLVVLSHVIEHIYDPRPFIVDVMKVVAPGGRLLIITPNAGSSSLVLVGRHWTMFKPLDHVSMLTEDGFRKMGLPDDMTLEFRQSEYSWQPVVELLQGLRDMMRGWVRPADRIVADNAAKPASHAWQRFERWRRIMWVFTLLSVPLHLFNRMAGTQACLVVELRRADAS